MRPCLFSHVMLSFVAVFAAFPACGEEPANPQGLDAIPVAKSVTVFPIVLTTDKPLPPGMSKNMAELVGLFLERGGMKEIEIADAKFSPPEKADLDKTAEAFGQFVRTRKISTAYALFGQFIGTPGKGVEEIRFAVVDRQGKVILSGQVDRQQLSRLGEKKVCPMTACVQLVSRLRGFWGLADPHRKDAPEGKMARLWAEKSGSPSKSEREAMQSRLDTLKKTIKTSTLAVFPVRTEEKSNPKVAVRLVEMLNKAGLGRAEAASTDPNLRIKGNTNEARILTDTARALRDFLHKNPPEADYALFAHYLMGRSSDAKTHVGGVHFVICDRNGDWVLLSLQNSHHTDFQQINPQSAEDCNRLVIEALKRDLR